MRFFRLVSDGTLIKQTTKAPAIDHVLHSHICPLKCFECVVKYISELDVLDTFFMAPL